MPKFRRVIALLLVILMIFGLAACSGNKGGSTADNGSTVDNSSSEGDGKWMPVEGANGDPNLRLPKIEFKSTEFTFLCTWEWAQPDPKRESAIRDIYKVTYKTVVTTPEENINKFVSMVMGGESPDLYISSFLPSLVNKGYLQDWDKYIDFNIGIWQGLKRSIDNLTFKGKHYGLDVQQARWDMVWYNKEIFEENGVKTPKEYYEEGNWNWNTFRDCAKALTIDADSNGDPELWGSAIDSQNCFVYTTGKEMITINPDGTATNNIKSPEIARAVQFYTDLCIKDKVVYEGSDSREQFVAGKVAMIVGGAWYRTPFLEMIKADKLWFVPYPKDPQADKYYIVESFGGMMMGKDCKNPEGAAAYMNATRYDMLDTNDDPPVTNEEILEKQNWTLDMDNWLWDEFYKKDDKYPVLSTWITFDLGKYWGDIWFRPKQGEAWSTIAEELAPKIDDDINKIMEG